LQAEAAHFAKVKGGPVPVVQDGEGDTEMAGGVKRALENGDGEEDFEAKRRRVLEETRDVDRDSEEEEDSSEDDRLVGFLNELGVNLAPEETAWAASLGVSSSS
jgi:protein CWC15